MHRASLHSDGISNSILFFKFNYIRHNYIKKVFQGICTLYKSVLVLAPIEMGIQRTHIVQHKQIAEH